MNLGEYQQAALRTWTDSGDDRSDLAYLAMGLVGESSEVSEHAKKVWRHGHDIDRERFKDELSDVIWYWVVLAHEMGLDLDEILNHNIAKLWRRYPDPDGFRPERSVNRVEYTNGEGA